MHTQHPPTSKAVVQQLSNNTTSWLGLRKSDQKEIIAGQTFMVPAEGDLETIEIFSAVVATPGHVLMTVHSFDPASQSWGPSLGSDKVVFNQSHNKKWVSFNIPGLHLNKGASHGFKLESQDSYLGLGESVGSASNPPLLAGTEWKFSKNNNKVDTYSYFSLAFKVGLKAA